MNISRETDSRKLQSRSLEGPLVMKPNGFLTFLILMWGIMVLSCWKSSGQVTNGPDGVYPLQKPAVGADQLQRAAEGKFLSWIRSYVNGQTNISFEELPNETTGQPMQQETLMPPSQGLAPQTVSAGTGDVITITGSGFGASRGIGTVPESPSNINI